MRSPFHHTAGRTNGRRRSVTVNIAAVLTAAILTTCVLLTLTLPPDPVAQVRTAPPATQRRLFPAGPRPVRDWPVVLDNSIMYTPAVADIDGDGRDEIAVGVKDCRVFLLDHDGRTLPGWPSETAAWVSRGTMLDDIDGDGEHEVAVGSIDGLLHMWREDGGIAAGWPIDLGGRATTAPIPVHPGGTDDASILVCVEPGTVHLLSPRGKDRDGWPKILPQRTDAGNFDRWPTWAADLDGDSKPEILHMTSSPAVLYAWYLDGDEYPGFPLEMGSRYGWGLAVDDRTDPRYLVCGLLKELIIHDLKTGRERSILLPDSNQVFTNSPRFLSSGGGMDSAADLLMASTPDGQVYVWDLEGRLLEGWPVRLDGFIYGLRESEEKHMIYGPPIMADVDGDGDREVILGAYDHHLYCFELDGTPVCGWPVVLDDFILQGLALAQLDGEGAGELVVGQFGETLFAWHLDVNSQPEQSGGGQEPHAFSGWLTSYYAVSLAVLLMLLLLVHLLRMEISGYSDSTGRRLGSSLIFVLFVLLIRLLFFSGDLIRYRSVTGRLTEAEVMVQTVLNIERERNQQLSDKLAADLQACKPGNLKDPLRVLRCLERLSDRNRLDYRFSGVLLADRSGQILRGVGLGRGWSHLGEMGFSADKADGPVLLGDIPVYAAESRDPVIAGEDTLRFFLLSSLLNKVPNKIADATGFSAHILVGGRAMAWGGAGRRPYISMRPWLGIMQPAREIGISDQPGGPTLTILLAKEDFERPLSQWLDLAAVLVIPCLYLLVASKRGERKRARLIWWWPLAFGVLYVAGAILLHRGRLETGPVPAAGRVLEVLLHMTGITGVVVVLHHAATSRRSRRLNFALLGSYLIVSLIPLSVIMIVGGNLFLGIQRDIIEKTIDGLETRADNMVLSYMGNRGFTNKLWKQGEDLLRQSTETSWLNFVAENQYLFNYDLPTAYITLWAHDREDPERYFTGYSYRAPRTGKLYYTRPVWTYGENVKGLFLDNGTAVVRAMRTYRHRAYEMDLVSHIPIDDRILDEMEERLRVLPFLPRIHLEPAWLESSAERSRPGGWYVPYSSELVIQARGWNSGKPRWAVYRASMYIPSGGEMLHVLIPVMLLILLPLGLSFWGAYTTFRRTARPLTHLLRGIRRVGEGDIEYRLGETGKSEIGLAAKSFDSMADSLEKTIREVAEKRKVEEVSKLKSHFISMVSHDLKTPLSSIRGAAENVLEEVAGPVTERQRIYLEMILKSSGDLQGMITDLLDLSRIESGRLILNIEPLDIRREAEDLLRSIQPLLEREELTGRLTVDSAETIVRGDRTRVWQMLSNIVSNAVLYSPAGGTIEVRIEDVPVDETDGRRMLRISVHDEGPGIPEEDAARLFEPFFYHSNGKTGGHGAGLGLAIVKQLVELHGGTVSLRNAPAGGAVFSFTLPA